MMWLASLCEASDLAEVQNRIEGSLADIRFAETEADQHAADLRSALLVAVRGGKKFRPALVLQTFRAFGGDPSCWSSAVDVAVAFELLHTSFIIHDDVIDRDTVRRGVPSLSARFTQRALDLGAAAENAHGYGTAAAIVAGDLLLHRAQSFVARVRLAEPVRLRLLDIFDRAVLVSAGGELSDVRHSLSRQQVTLDQAMQTGQDKTATYSFEAPLQAGAVVASAPAEVVELLGHVGARLGTAFQLVDDLVGVFGSDTELGKSALSDLREGKATPMITFALSTMLGHQIAPFLGDPALTEHEAQGIRASLVQCGAREFIRELVAGQVADAARLLDDERVPEQLRRGLRVLGDELNERAAVQERAA